jgi:hypothetical protein
MKGDTADVVSKQSSNLITCPLVSYCQESSPVFALEVPVAVARLTTLLSCRIQSTSEFSGELHNVRGIVDGVVVTH